MKLSIKNYIRLVLMFIAANIPQLAGAYDFMVDGLAYNIKSSDAVSVTRADYSGLTAANIPSNVTYNGQTYSVTSIEESAFWQCGDLTSVTIPNTVKSIGEGAFYYCFGLNRVNISDLAAWCSICFYGDEYYGKNGNPLCYAGNLYIDGTLVNDLVIPSTVSVINRSAFSRCSCITSVTIPNSVVTIDERAFYSSSLTTVTIPESVTSVGVEAFSYCSGLTSVTIPKSVTSIGNYAFEDCSGLNSLTLTGKGPYIFNSSQLVGLNNIISQIKTLNVGSEITSLGNFSFAPDVINSYAAAAPTCLSGTFSNYDGELHVPVASTAAYFLADYWQNFNNLTNDLSERVLLNIEEANIVKGGTMELTATTSPEGCNIVWSSSNPKVAIVDDDGVVTAIEEGECYIFATLESNPAIYASCHITSSYPEISLSLNTDFLNMRFGEEAILVATIMPDNLGLIPTWTSSNTSVATVNNGLVTAVGEGECDISVIVLDKTATCHVVVNSNVIISLNKNNAIIGANQILTVLPSCVPDVPIDFVVNSSDPSVAAVRLIDRSKVLSFGLLNCNEKGQALAQADVLSCVSSNAPAYASEKSIMIVGVSYGAATITVSSADGKATPATISVGVVDVDGDGTITATDVTAIYNHLLDGDESFMETSDIDGDGYITSTDITVLYNIILGN